MRRASQAVIQQASSMPAKPDFIPPPVGGWNTLMNPHAGDPNFAEVLTNWWVKEDALVVRGGTEDFIGHGDGSVGQVKSIYTHKTAGGVETVWVFSDSGIWSIAQSTPYGAMAASSTNGLWQAVLFTNSAGTVFLWAVNGTDSALYYNGAAWANPTITGVTSSTLNYVWVFKRRLFCIQENSMNAWYLPVDSIQGVATKLPVGGNFSRGGFLLSGFSWTLDGGNGPDDYCGFITSEGEIAIYQGTDPDSPSSWGLIGVYYVGKPAAARCWAKVAGDILIATQMGLFSMAAMSRGEEASPGTALSANFYDEWVRLWNLAVTAPGTITWGWQVVVYPTESAVIVNIPFTNPGTSTFQFVLNLAKNVWAKFEGWQAGTFQVKGGINLLASDTNGTEGFVNNCWTGTTDVDNSTSEGPLPIEATFTQGPFQLNGGGEFLLTQVKPDFRLTASGDLQFCGNMLPAAYVNRWTNPSLAAAHNPNEWLGITCTLTSSTAQKYYGCWVRRMSVPIST